MEYIKSRTQDHYGAYCELGQGLSALFALRGRDIQLPPPNPHSVGTCVFFPSQSRSMHFQCVLAFSYIMIFDLWKVMLNGWLHYTDVQ